MKEPKRIVFPGLVTVILMTVLTAMALAAPATPAGGSDSPYALARYREMQHVTIEGRIRGVERAQDGFRFDLEGSPEHFWVSEHRVRERGVELRVGEFIRVGGMYRGGAVVVDDIDRLDREERGDRDRMHGEAEHVIGYVDRVDRRHEILVVHDERTGRMVTVETRRADEHADSIDISSVHRGDHVELSGQWRGGAFHAWRIDGIRRGRR